MSVDVNWSKVGLGTGTLASLGRAASLRDVSALLHCMKDNGITVIDTADSYASGDCEVMLGRAFHGHRDAFTIVTKAGYRLANLPGPFRPLNQFLKKGMQKFGERQMFGPSYIERCLHNSLRRLNTNFVDAFMLHDPPPETASSHSLLETLRKLKESGKTQLIGLSSDNPIMIAQALATGVFDVLQTPAGLSTCRNFADIWHSCQSQGIHVVGNHIFDPTALQFSCMGHKRLMRASSAVLPDSATILCGTRKTAHLLESLEWAFSPMSESELEMAFSEFDSASTAIQV